MPNHSYCQPPAAICSLPIVGSPERFPVRAIYCVGRNYADHSREMGSNPADSPCFFMKPPHALVTDDHPVPYPPQTRNLHHEVELVVALRSGGRNIAPEAVFGHVFGYAVGLDLTRRDLQNELKQKAQPWELAKSFTGSAPCSALIPATRPEAPSVPWHIRLSVNGVIRQETTSAQMIWPIERLIGELSRYEALEAGDLLFTGTPAGVGPLEPGDRGVAELVGRCRLLFTVVPGGSGSGL
ncbi:fumarylacetoacetate (FAA) hydrolase [mine drainage metagenome]|uniref:Fumarylacetoacetate (FAA) hydrolase n=1 Tax=mine drainage metagenome TaxID=410659 RepID=T1C5M4_9ZZZZ